MNVFKMSTSMKTRFAATPECVQKLAMGQSVYNLDECNGHHTGTGPIHAQLSLGPQKCHRHNGADAFSARAALDAICALI